MLWPVLFAAAACALPRPQTDAERGRLVAFVLPSESPVASGFQRDGVPAVRALAEELGIAFELRDARQGAPAEVAIAPLLVYQNFRGRSVYEGRTTTPARLANFLRTARIAPQGSEPFVLENVPAWLAGRARVAAPMKVTALSGVRPSGYSEGAFQTEVRRMLGGGFQSFRLAERVALRRTDRRFYFDVHSHCGDDGRLFVTVEVYSQFHCKQPVFSRLAQPLEGTWAERAETYAEAARLLERETLAVIASPRGGDGFEPLDAELPAPEWGELGLALPAAPERAESSFAPADLPTAWRLAAAQPDDAPRLTFHFLSPLDGMRGEVGQLTGELQLGPKRTFASARGWVEAEVRSVTMGDADLDQWIGSESILDVAQHPRARFDLRALALDAPALAFGRLTSGVATGSFEMKGLSVPLEMRLQLEAVVDAQGAPVLLAQGAFELPILEPFGLRGPGGPERANTTLSFDVDFALRPLR